jgi:hypothetical protein
MLSLNLKTLAPQSREVRRRRIVRVVKRVVAAGLEPVPREWSEECFPGLAQSFDQRLKNTSHFFNGSLVGYL